MQGNVLSGKLKQSELCIGLIQIFEIPKGDDFRLFQDIDFLHSYRSKIRADTLPRKNSRQKKF